MFFLPPSLSKVTGLVATGAVGALVARVTRRRSATSGDSAETLGVSVDGDPSASRHRFGVATSIAPRRVRVGRLRLPHEVIERTLQDEPALTAVNEFADRLAELPVGSWLDAGRAVMADRSSVESRSASYAILDATINDRGLAVSAWYVRDAIETSAFYASESVTRWTSSDRRAFAAAHAAAEEAALALLARDYIPVDDYTLLCTAFASLAREVTHSDR